MSSRFRLVRLATVCGLLAIALVACESTPVGEGVGPSAVRPGALKPASNDQKLIAEIRQATAKYQNIDVAYADNYVVDDIGCMDATSFGLDPSVGGMGFHLTNWALHDDPATDPLHPDVLVYEPARSANGKPKLVALEYENFRADWYAAGNTAPPTLLGHEFESIDFEEWHVFGLHFWLWLDNPSGAFTDFNPKTSCG
jgi:hypothetical protein